MNVKALLIVGMAGVMVGATFAGCQTYDFEPVEPLAIAQTTERKIVISRKKKPNIMLLVDKSGSMMDPVDATLAACGSCGACNGCPACPSNCPTRLVDMKSAMQTFLGQYGTTARFGLSVFPGGTSSADPCKTGHVVQEVTASNDVDSELQGSASQINDSIQQLGRTGGLPVVGGTPTAASLSQLSSNPALQEDDRDNFVLLLTDGLPNCNSNLDGTKCTCVTGETTCDKRNCLDDTAVVQAISGLASQDIRTIVVGFGADTAASGGLGALNAMAQAGGFARSCQTNQDCGSGDTCDTATSTCGKKFFPAANAEDLAAELIKIQNKIGDVNPCEFLLSASPTDVSFLAVYVDGQRLTAGPSTWSYDSSGQPTVTFSGDTCTRLMNASESAPVDVEIRVVEGL